MAAALEELPALARALDRGALSWSALRELTRVASRDTERDWLEFARGKTVRQLEEVVAGARHGDGPGSPRVPAVRRHVLRFEVTPETFALFREASAHLRRNSDVAFDDDATLLAMARAVLGGPTDAGRASYQVALSVCTECGRAQQHASGALVAIGPEIVAMASCGAQHIGNVTMAVNDDASSAEADAADVSVGAGTQSSDPVVAWDIDARQRAAAARAPVRAHTSARARQTIPPAIRRAVLARDRHRCCVPGCKNATFVDLHHLRPRSEGGSNDAANLRTLCGAHHRAVHRGELSIEGAASGLRFCHSDGRPYGEIGVADVPRRGEQGTFRAVQPRLSACRGPCRPGRATHRRCSSRGDRRTAAARSARPVRAWAERAHVNPARPLRGSPAPSGATKYLVP